MAAVVNMRNALQRCGFNLATSDFIMGQGYDSPEELLSVSEDDLDLMIKSASRHPPVDVQFPSLPIRKLYVLRFWAAERLRVGLPMSPILFTEQVMNEYATLMRSDEVEIEARKNQDPTKPDAIKNEKDWFKFWEKFKNYLGRIRGAAKIPLSYVIRDHDEVTESMRDEVYENHTKRLIACTVLSGEHYRIDNESVWVELKGLVIDGFAWSYIKKFEKKQEKKFKKGTYTKLDYEKHDYEGYGGYQNDWQKRQEADAERSLEVLESFLLTSELLPITEPKKVWDGAECMVLDDLGQVILKLEVTAKKERDALPSDYAGLDEYNPKGIEHYEAGQTD